MGSVRMSGKEEKVLQLILDVRAGDRTAFSGLLDAYRPLILSQVSRFSGSGHEWEELMQDAALALYRAALCYRADLGVPFGAYARASVANALVSASRKLRPAQELVPLDEMIPYLEAEGDEPERRVIAAEESDGLYRAALACLSPYELRVFFLYIRGYTPREIAPEVGRSEKSVSNAIGRMLAKLRAHLN